MLSRARKGIILLGIDELLILHLGNLNIFTKKQFEKQESIKLSKEWRLLLEHLQRTGAVKEVFQFTGEYWRTLFTEPGQKLDKPITKVLINST